MRITSCSESLGRVLARAPWADLALIASLSLLGLASAPPLRTQIPEAAQLQKTSALQGRLVVSDAAGLRLSTSSGDIAVTSSNPQLLHTLQDSRLHGREVRLEGERTPSGQLNVSHILVVRDGKLYRLRYYCHVCNIPATEPGPCVCCQRPTELEEIPEGQVTPDMVLVP